MWTFLRLFWAFLQGLLGIGKKRRKRGRVQKRATPTQVVSRLRKRLAPVRTPGGPWDPREQVRIEDGRVAIDLHGLSDEGAVALVEEALALCGPGPVPLRLITGHGRDRAAGYSLIRVALVDALDGRAGLRIEDAARHRRHARADDRVGHMDLMVG